MKIKLALICLILAVSLTGCSQSKAPASEGEVMPATTSTEAEESESVDTAYVGTWTRLSVFTDGEPVTDEPATLDLKSTTYNSSTSLCSSNGTVEVKGVNTIVLHQSGTDCPGYAGPNVFTYTYTLGEDEDGIKTMTTTTIYDGHTITEEYIEQPSN